MSPSVGSVFHSSNAPSESLLPPRYFISNDPEGGGGGGASLEVELVEPLLVELRLLTDELERVEELLEDFELLLELHELDDHELLDQLLDDHELELHELEDQELELPDEELQEDPLLEEPELEGELPLLLDQDELLAELQEELLPLDQDELPELPEGELHDEPLLEGLELQLLELEPLFDELELGNEDQLLLDAELNDELVEPLLDEDVGIRFVLPGLN